MQVVLARAELSPALFELAQVAATEGVRNVGLLAAEFASGANRFAGEGEALFAAYVEGELAGVGGVNRQPAAGLDAMRMRRFYVSPRFRRSGVGQALAAAAIQQGFRPRQC